MLQLVLTGAFSADPAILLQALEGLSEEDVEGVTAALSWGAMRAEGAQDVLHSAIAVLRLKCKG